MKFDSTLLACLSSVKFIASMIYLQNVDFFSLYRVRQKALTHLKV